ncbi:MAG: arginine--tRNA ligase [Clostridia bacterium]|nr:arginine--tRNA ligase [Clostridia bacterium]
MDFKEEIVKMLDSNIEELSYEEIDKLLEVPKESKLGDYAMPCFSLSKIFRKAPNIIAEELKEKLEVPSFLDKIESISGYLNFFINRKEFSKSIIDSILNNDDYGSSNLGDGKNVILDYASLNVAKPFHIGHLKNAVTGNSLYRIYKKLGYNPIAINHLGDFGTQFGKLIYAYKTWGDDEKIKENGIYELTDLYQKFHVEAEKDPSLEDKGREWSLKIEEKDPEAIRIWTYFKDISIEYFNRLADKMDLKFDKIIGEAFYMDFVDDTVKKIKEKNLLVESEGAQVVMLDEYNMPPCIILRSDGGSLYATRDITGAIYRAENFNFVKSIYITGSEQILHFKQWFKVIEKMGYPWANGLVHLGHGMVKLESGKLSTRGGNIITLEEAINEAKEKALEIMIQNGRDGIENREQVAEDIGIGAMTFINLYNSANKDVTFSWETALRFDGETGPYLQYTHARCNSLIKKAGQVDYSKVNPELYQDQTTFEVIKALNNYQNVIVSAGEKFEPSYICRYLIDLAQKFNKFYNEYSIVVDDEEVKATRIALVSAVKKVLKDGLHLVCIKAPDEM